MDRADAESFTSPGEKKPPALSDFTAQSKTHLSRPVNIKSLIQCESMVAGENVP